MLQLLHIENIAVIERADIELDKGLTVLSGETGAGKSIVIDSIGALLGGRDHSTIIHGVQKISDEYESDETTRSLIDTIKKKINPN